MVQRKSNGKGLSIFEPRLSVPMLPSLYLRSSLCPGIRVQFGNLCPLTFDSADRLWARTQTFRTDPLGESIRLSIKKRFVEDLLSPVKNTKKVYGPMSDNNI